jgi:flagellar hook-basal body complex protein FliE
MPLSRKDDESIFTIINEKIGRPEFERELKKVNDDVQGLSKKLEEGVTQLTKSMADLRDALIQSQQASYRRIIYVQGTILVIILGTVITLLVRVLFH